MESGAGLVKTPAVPRRRAARAARRRAARPALSAALPPLRRAGRRGRCALRRLLRKLLRPITAPYCPVLGLPFEVSLGPDARSAEAIADPPPFDRARSAVIYNEVAAQARQPAQIRRPAGARPLLRAADGARRRTSSGRTVRCSCRCRCIAARQFERRYNQSTELARALGRITGLAVDPAARRPHAPHARSRSGSRPMRGSATSPAPSPRSPMHCAGSRAAAS